MLTEYSFCKKTKSKSKKQKQKQKTRKKAKKSFQDCHTLKNKRLCDITKLQGLVHLHIFSLSC